jgi:hypothetical protein
MPGLGRPGDRARPGRAGPGRGGTAAADGTSGTSEAIEDAGVPEARGPAPPAHTQQKQARTRQLMKLVNAGVVQRRNGRGGRSAEEHLVAGLRCLYKQAEDDGLIGESDNPARKGPPGKRYHQNGLKDRRPRVLAYPSRRTPRPP